METERDPVGLRFQAKFYRGYLQLDPVEGIMCQSYLNLRFSRSCLLDKDHLVGQRCWHKLPSSSDFLQTVGV